MSALDPDILAYLRRRMRNAALVARRYPESEPFAHDRARQLGVMIEELERGDHLGADLVEATLAGSGGGEAGSVARILEALRPGPLTGAELAQRIGMRSGLAAARCARLLADGRVRRIDGGEGSGTRAVYALGDGSRSILRRAPRKQSAQHRHPGPPVPADLPLPRDPCFFCGTRGDLGCSHREAGQ